MSDFDETPSAEYVEYNLARVRRLRARAAAAREMSLLDSVADVLPDVHGEASAAESNDDVIAPPRPDYPINDGMIDEAEVPPGTEVFETPDDAIAWLDARAAATGTQDNLAAFARARLNALLLDSSVKDPQLVSAAKALLRDHAPKRNNTGSSGERTVFLLPGNERGGPPPYGRVFYIRARATPKTAPAADSDD
jgi:hypothetical protein